MTYGFELTSSRGITRLTKSYKDITGEPCVLEINGISIVGYSRSILRELLGTIASTKEKVSFLLDNGTIVDFYPDASPSDWNTQKVAEQA